MPYVTDPTFDTVGIGRIEVIPRRILLVQDIDETQPIDESAGVREERRVEEVDAVGQGTAHREQVES